MILPEYQAVSTSDEVVPSVDVSFNVSGSALSESVTSNVSGSALPESASSASA